MGRCQLENLQAGQLMSTVAQNISINNYLCTLFKNYSTDIWHQKKYRNF